MGLSLEISHVWKKYNGKQALKDCSVSFGKRGVYAVMGPNGSGKSTLLRLCALLEEPDDGAVVYTDNGHALRNDLGLKRRMTLVLPRVGVFNTTVFKNVAYGLKIRGIRNASLEQRVDSALKSVGLTHKQYQNALTLSSGETQRLGIARAVVVEPELLFLDEPTASIDEENTEIVEGIISAMKKEEQTTVVITTHDREQAERLADTIIMMQDGKIVNEIFDKI